MEQQRAVLRRYFYPLGHCELLVPVVFAVSWIRSHIQQHRCTTALFHILQEAYYSEFIRSLIDTYRHTGWLPDGRSSFSNGAVQGGTNADNVLADAYVKGVAGASPNGGINWEDAYEALLKNANTVPPNNHDPRDPTGSTAEGKGALPDYSQLGYITPRFGRSVSRAVE